MIDGGTQGDTDQPTQPHRYHNGDKQDQRDQVIHQLFREACRGIKIVDGLYSSLPGCRDHLVDMAVEIIEPGLNVGDRAVHRQQVAAVIVILADNAGFTVDRLKKFVGDWSK